MEEKKKRLSGSTAAKITAFFLLAVSFITGVIGAVGTSIVYTDGRGSQDGMTEAFMWESVTDDVEAVRYFYFQTSEETMAENYFAERNSSVEVFVEDEKIWSCYDGQETPYVFTSYGYMPGRLLKSGQEYYFDTEASEEGVYYTIYLYVDDDFPVEDSYKTSAEAAAMIYDMRSVFPAALIISVFVLLISFIFLMCGAGHKNGREGIAPSVISELPLDLVTAAFGFAAILGVLLFLATWDDGFAAGLLMFLIIGTVEIVWCTIYCVELATRLKMGKFWRNTLIYIILRFAVRAVKWGFRTIGALIRGIPLTLNALIAFATVCIVELFFCILWGAEDAIFVWFLDKVLLLPVLVYFTLVCKKLLQGSRALAEGNLNYHVDTSRMLLDFKEHGENLNRIGEGIAAVVEERMRSERLKTELITNVSHDLKTPLTSIINYADLLGHANLEKEKVAEYADVLLRQSKRLKKLLEDLMEASKATTGNLEVNLVPCEISVLLSQAVGEYEQRFAERGLDLITRQPEESVRILADGRHLWRTFDNLLNNIYKYAQDNTRIYLNVEKKDSSVEIIFRNMSKYPLEMPGEELQERFVRGDKSRHMEGNGLGLSIAKSLVELQNGSMEIITDGDLFKVILRFQVLPGKEEGSAG